jgi:hypothetical protein
MRLREIILVLLIFQIVFMTTASAAGYVDWWNQTFRLRKGIIVDTQYNLTDYQVKITSINTTKLYEEGKIDAMCKAIRFTNYNFTTDIETLVPHWNQTPCIINGGNTTFWVKGNFSDRNTAQDRPQIYVYYKNISLVQDDSNFSATFTKDFKINATGGVDATLKAQWNFDEGSGNTVRDGSDNRNDGIIGGPAGGVRWSGANTDGGFWDTRTDVKFSYGSYLDFNGGIVKVPHSDSLNLSKNMTIEMWVKGQSLPVSQLYTYQYNNGLHSPQMHVVGNKIHYVWIGHGTYGIDQIFTGVYDLESRSFVATQRTTTDPISDVDVYWKASPQMQVVGNKIYYVWMDYDEVGSDHYYRIWTASLDLSNDQFTIDGNTYRRQVEDSYAVIQSPPEMQVVGNAIYYVWIEEYKVPKDSVWQIWRATQTSSVWSEGVIYENDYSKHEIDFQVVGNNIYYVWWHLTAGDVDFYAASSTTTGNINNVWPGEIGNYRQHEPEIQVIGDKIYIVFWEYSRKEVDIVDFTISTGTWSQPTPVFTSGTDEMSPKIQIVGSKVYIALTTKTSNTAYGKAYLCVSNVDERTYTCREVGQCNPYSCFDAQFQVVGGKAYYAYVAGNNRAGVADVPQSMSIGNANSNIIAKDDAYGISTTSINSCFIEPFIDAGLDELKYRASPIDYSNGISNTYCYLSQDTWKYFALGYNGTNVNFGLNGSINSISTFNKPLHTNPFNLLIGDGFSGSIDDVRIYNRSLSPGEIKAHYERRKYIDPEPNLWMEPDEEGFDQRPPWFENAASYNRYAGCDTIMDILIRDDVQLSSYIFSFDNCTGDFVNDTAQETYRDNYHPMRVVKGISTKVGCLIRWQVYANDTKNKWNMSDVYSFLTEKPPEFVDILVKDETLRQLAPPKYYGAITSAKFKVNITAIGKDPPPGTPLNITIYYSNTSFSETPSQWNATFCKDAQHCEVIVPAYNKNTKIHYYLNVTDGIRTDFYPYDYESNPFYLLMYEHPIAEFMIKQLKLTMGSSYIVPIHVQNIFDQKAYVDLIFEDNQGIIFVEGKNKKQTVSLYPGGERIVYARIIPTKTGDNLILNASLYFPQQSSVTDFMRDSDVLRLIVDLPPNFPEFNWIGIGLMIAIAGLIFYIFVKN